MNSLQVPQRGPCGERCLFPMPSFTYSLGSPEKEHPSMFPHTDLQQTEMLRFHRHPSSVSQESPVNKTLSRFPNRAPMKKVARFQCLLYASLGLPSKSSPDIKISPFSQSPWAVNIPSMFPKTGPLWKQMPVSRALFNIFFRVPSRGALPPGSLHRAPTNRDVSFPELSSSLPPRPW